MIVRLVIRWLVIACAFLLIANFIPGIGVANTFVALLASLLWGLVLLFVRPVLKILTFPITILTLGLFSFILNALLFWLLAALVSGFTVSNFFSAFAASVILSLVNWLLSRLM